MSEKINVLLAGSEAELSGTLRNILESEGWINVVGASRSSVEAQELARSTSPEIIVIDLDFEGDGIQASQDLLKVSPDSKIVVLNIHDYIGKVSVHPVSQAGAVTLESIEALSKDSSPAELIKAISKSGKKQKKRRIQ